MRAPFPSRSRTASSGRPSRAPSPTPVVLSLPAALSLATALSLSGLFAGFALHTPLVAQETGPPADPDAALLDAAGRGDTARVRRALEAGASLEARDAVNGLTPLATAAYFGRRATLELLLAAGADPDLPGADGTTPLMAALVAGASDVALLLARRTRRPDARHAEAWTALHAAAAEGEWAVAAVLLERGADPDARGPEGWTPLTAAARQGGELTTRLLLCHGADPEAPARDGRRPADVARAFGNGHLVGTLETAGCDRDVVDGLREAEERASRAARLVESGRYVDALPTSLEVLSIRERLLGAEHPLVWESLYQAGRIAFGAGDLESARSLAERTLESVETVRGREDLDYAAAVNNLALTLMELGDYARAAALFERALEIKERLGTGWDRETAVTLENLGGLLVHRGRLADAAPLLERAVRIHETIHGPGSPETGRALGNLALLRAAQGDLPSAVRLLERGTRALDGAGGGGGPIAAWLAGRLAEVRLAQGETEAAITLLEDALATARSAVDPGHPRLAELTVTLARAHRAAGDPARAEALLREAEDALAARLGPDHPAVAGSLHQLGRLLLDLRRPEEARGPLERAAGILEGTFGPDHPGLVPILDELGLALAALVPEDPAAATARFDRAAEILDRHLESSLATLSFAERRAFLERRLPLQKTLLLAFHRDPEGVEEAYRHLVRWKGHLVHALRVETEIARRAGGDEEFRMMRENLGRVRERLATVSLGGPEADPWESFGWAPVPPGTAGTESSEEGELPPASPGAPAELDREDLRALTERKESLERELARMAVERGYEPVRRFDLDRLVRTLPPSAALVDIHRHDFPEGDGTAPRYTAIVTGGDGGLRRVDLGPAAPVDSAVAAWRRRAAAGGAAGEAWSDLLERVWSPVAAALPPDTRTAWVSPDGALVRLPWTLLASDRPETSDLVVAQVDSPRGLVALLDGAGDAAGGDEGPGEILLVGGVDFDPAPTDRGRTRTEPAPTEPGPRPSPAAADSGRGGPFAPLPGTTREVRTLEALAREAGLRTVLLTGRAATVEAVRETLPDVDIAHLATHGFFLGEALGGPAARGLPGLPGRPSEGPPGAGFTRNPLVESGIALAGANRGAGADRDTPGASGLLRGTGEGVLTAEELVGIDLSGLDLLVLSACDTGRGTEVTGQGVLGLQAAAIGAGARSVVMSLWKVPDESTALLMESFYRQRWQRGLSKAEALREARRAVRDHPSGEFRSPVHWAAWVLVGDPR